MAFLLVVLAPLANPPSGAEAPKPPPVIPCAQAPQGMSCVPGGWFVRGSDDDRHTCVQRFGKARRKRPNARPAARVWLQTFFMDRREVTYADYEACIKAAGCKPRAEDGRWGPRYNDFDRPQQPITGVSWYHAVEYCRWRKKLLPSEAQWEKAARGPDGEPFPWGDDPASCTRAVIKDPELGRSCGVKKKGSASTGRVVAVGSRPAGRYDLFDMIGNVEEWVFDWYSDDWAACGTDCLGIEPRGPCAGKEPCAGHQHRVVRGGSWYWDKSHGTAIHRRPHFPDNAPPKRYHHFGFRCAANPEQAAALIAE